MIDSEKGVYEIKPCSYNRSSRRRTHLKQLNGYIEALGEPYHRGEINVYGSFKYGEFLVSYYTDGDGMIYYEFGREVDFSLEDVAEVAALGAGAALLYGITGFAASFFKKGSKIKVLASAFGV